MRHTLTQLYRIGEREEARSSEREQLLDIIFCLWVLLLPLVLVLSLRKLRGFILYGFLEENLCVYCLLCFIVVLVVLIILLVKDPKIMLA